MDQRRRTRSAVVPGQPSVKPFARDALPGRIVFGAGSLSGLADEVVRLGSRPALVSDLPAAMTDRLAAQLPGLVLQWDEVRQHVPVDLADRATRAVTHAAADVVVSAGGGSATGLAKAMALRGGPPILAVPTTYAGSEMTPIWGQSQGSVKTTGRDARVLPATVVYDPELLLGLPAHVVGPSGMNALAHCVEALYAPAADPLSSLGAVEGARLLVTHLPAAYATADIEARGQVLWAACLAGSALGTVGASLHHSICHLLGGMFDLPHATMHAVVLPHVLAALLPAVQEKLSPLAEALDVDVSALPGLFWRLGQMVGTPIGLGALGMPADGVEAAAEALVRKTPSSPLPVDIEFARNVLHAALVGSAPATTQFATVR